MFGRDIKVLFPKLQYLQWAEKKKLDTIKMVFYL